MNLTDAEKMARELIAEHVPGVKFHFDNGRKRFGCCYSTRRSVFNPVPEPVKITLSRHLTALNSVEIVREVILHEIAHAKAPGAGHGWQWKVEARKLGIKGDRCYDTSKVVQPELRFVGVCPSGDRTHDIHRASNPRGRRSSCRQCGFAANHRNGFDPRFQFVWYDRQGRDLPRPPVGSGRPVTPDSTATLSELVKHPPLDVAASSIVTLVQPRITRRTPPAPAKSTRRKVDSSTYDLLVGGKRVAVVRRRGRGWELDPGGFFSVVFREVQEHFDRTSRPY